MYKIGFIGMGNMASALMTGIIKAGYLQANDICGADISEQARMKANDRGIKVCENNHEVIAQSELVIVAVKPQVLESVINDVHDDLKNKAVMSIALGYDLEKLIGAYTGSGSSDYDSDSDYDWDSDSDSDYDYSEYGYESY